MVIIQPHQCPLLCPTKYPINMSEMMASLPDRIQRRLAELGKSARRASIDGGLAPDAIRNILRNKSSNPRRDTLEGIAYGLNWTLESLLELQRKGSPNTYLQIQNVPLISWLAAETAIAKNDRYVISGTEDLIPVSYYRDTLIALRVQDTSMNRVAPNGSIIIVDFSDRILTPEKYYIVKHNDHATFKRYRPEPARLEPDSTESYDTIFLKTKTAVFGRVIQVTRTLS